MDLKQKPINPMVPPAAQKPTTKNQNKETMIIDIEELYVECSCGGEVLKLEYDKEMRLYDFAVFHLNGKRSWKNRWKQIWHIIKTGEPYADNLVLKQEDLDKIVSFIDDINEAK